MHKILVYGTLRSMEGQPTTTVKGRLYNLGWYPGIILDEDGDDIVCEEIEATDEQLKHYDDYESYDEKRPETSLYIRRTLGCGRMIYEYNRPVAEYSRIQSGDWANREEVVYDYDD
jgi:gamma-glutamylcyclotransferase (GGCT)/AIG2-like uncharacterized protein YtfP